MPKRTRKVGRAACVSSVAKRDGRHGEAAPPGRIGGRELCRETLPDAAEVRARRCERDAGLQSREDLDHAVVRSWYISGRPRNGQAETGM